MEQRNHIISVQEGSYRLKVFEHIRSDSDPNPILECLKKDSVALVKGVDSTSADDLVEKVAGRLELADSLELQAGFATYLGHRRNVNRFFMTVNSRDAYQFVPPHSEGNSFSHMELAAFYCYENTTDGGETILINVDGTSRLWESLREKVRRARLSAGKLAQHEASRVRGLYNINLPADILRDDDQVLKEYTGEIPGLTILDVLAKPRKAYSRILNQDLYVLWDAISAIDFDSSAQYAHLLRQWGLLKEPLGGMELVDMDNCAKRHLWHSGIDYSQLFRCKITLKLNPGDLIIQNNLTWTHSVNNWTPGSGNRNVVAAFA